MHIKPEMDLYLSVLVYMTLPGGQVDEDADGSHHHHEMSGHFSLIFRYVKPLEFLKSELI